MQQERACYSWTDIFKAQKLIEDFSFSVQTKKDHGHKLYQLKELINNQLYPLQAGVFPTEYNYGWQHYYDVVNDGRYKKTDMDVALYQAKTELLYGIRMVRNLIERGEVDVTQ